MDSKESIKPDIVMKEFWRVNERFADLFNAVLFNGKNVIKSDMLKEMDTDISGTIKWKKGQSSLKRVRDIVKKEYDGVEFNILGIEIQDKVHYAMPLRTMIYDGLGYLKEYNELKSKNRYTSGMTSDEFLSGMKKDDRLHPIITIVLYYSEMPWDGPVSIKDMMIHMRPEIENIFTDYKMNLVQIRESDRYKFKNKDVKMVFDITKSIYEENFNNIYDKYNHRNISIEVLRMISVMTDAPYLMDIADNNKRGNVNMCNALKKLQDESKLLGRQEGLEAGRQEGLEAGRQEGLETGRSEERIKAIVSMLELGLTKEQITTKYSEDEYEKAEEEYKRAQELLRASQAADRLYEFIMDSENIVFFGGAGVSTESGIPDFRSKDGLYNQHDVEFDKYEPEYLLSAECLHHKPKVFFEFYRQKMDARGIQPNITHKVLAELEKMGKLKAVITQNIDGLHQLAGSKNVIELHGATTRNYCEKCRKKYPSDYIYESKEAVPHCTVCGGIVRPDVTLYGEQLPAGAYESAVKAIKEADMFIVAGTSLKVYPAAGLVWDFKGNHLVVLNREPLDFKLDAQNDIEYTGSMGDVFAKLDNMLHMG